MTPRKKEIILNRATQAIRVARQMEILACDLQHWADGELDAEEVNLSGAYAARLFAHETLPELEGVLAQ